MLGTEVSEVTKPYARFWVGLTRRHPVAMPMADLVIYVAVVSLAWIFVGSTAGVRRWSSRSRSTDSEWSGSSGVGGGGRASDVRTTEGRPGTHLGVVATRR